MKIQTIVLTLLVISLAGLTGCQAEQPVTETKPAVEPTLGNLIIVTIPPQATQENSGRVPPPVGAPVRPNASLATVEVLSLTAVKEDPEFVIVHAMVTAATPAEGFDAYDPNLVGQEIDIHLAVGEAANLVPGDIILLTLSYRGDEWGGGYYGTDISYLK